MMATLFKKIMFGTGGRSAQVAGGFAQCEISKCFAAKPINMPPCEAK
jgi:hypothetical protein